MVKFQGGQSTTLGSDSGAAVATVYTMHGMEQFPVCYNAQLWPLYESLLWQSSRLGVTIHAISKIRLPCSRSPWIVRSDDGRVSCHVSYCLSIDRCTNFWHRAVPTFSSETYKTLSTRYTSGSGGRAPYLLAAVPVAGQCFAHWWTATS